MKDSKKWTKSKGKGNIAENIFQFIINSIQDKGWSCIPFGIEQHVDYVKEKLRNDNSNTSLKIRHTPDFIVINERTEIVMLFECKFRNWIGRKTEYDIKGEGETAIDVKSYNPAFYEFNKGQINRYRKFWPETIIFTVHPFKHCFYIVELSKIKDNMLINTKELNGHTVEKWDFHKIETSLISFFPDIPEEIIDEAKKMIPGTIRK